MIKLYVATPCFGNKVFADYMMDVMELNQACQSWGIEFDVSLVGNFPVLPLARSQCVKHFLDTDFTHMLFVDADVSFSPWNARRLLDFDEDFCCSVYPKKEIKWDRLTGKRLATPEEIENQSLDFTHNPLDSELKNGFVECKAAATGFMLLKRVVFERMIDAYPELSFKPNYGSMNVEVDDANLYAFFDTMIDSETREYHGDDNSFCRRWTDIGGKIYADVTFPIGHIGLHKFGGKMHERVLRSLQA